MQQWEFLLLAVSMNAWQKPAPVVSVIDRNGQMTQHTFPEFHALVNGLGEQGWQLAHIEENSWVFKRSRQELA
jgi:hypothetical protein